MSAAWDDRVAAFWADADEDDPDRMLSGMDALVAERGADDPVALYELASVRDLLGREAEAVPLYRAALERGLGGPRRTQATIQLASSLRNIGEPDEAIALLQCVDPDRSGGDAAQVFLALALHDRGRHAEALQAIAAPLLPMLSMYASPLAAYLDELVDGPADAL